MTPSCVATMDEIPGVVVFVLMVLAGKEFVNDTDEAAVPMLGSNCEYAETGRAEDLVEKMKGSFELGKVDGIAELE